MRIITAEYDSAVLGHTAPYSVIIPDHLDGSDNIPYVLITHGMTDTVRSWIEGTRITEYLESHGFAAVMPFAANSYYTDMAAGDRFWTQITDELPEMAAVEYGFSRERSRRFVMGNSMGGYGALKVALSFPERYAAAVSFSGVTDIAYRFCDCGFWPEDGVANWGADYKKTLPGSRNDLYTLVREVESCGDARPVIRQICGTEDYLYRDNIRFRDFMLSRTGWDYDYAEDTGSHWWDFWDRKLPGVLDFFEGLL